MTHASLLSRVKHSLSYLLKGTSGLPTSWFDHIPPIDGQPNTLTQPYANSVWVHAAVGKVAGPISAVELCWMDMEGEEVENPQLDEFWRAPAVNCDGTRIPQSDFLEICAKWLLLSGEVFLLQDDTWSVPFPEVAPFGGFTPLLIGRPDKMRPLVSGLRLMGWELTDANGKRHNLPLEQVYQIKLFNPYNEWRGLAPLDAAMIAAGGDYAAGVYAKNTAEANGDQGVFVVAKQGLLDQRQREQIVSQLREKRAAQQRGIFRPVFLTGDITIEDPKVRAVDAAFVAQRTAARQEIAIAFGVPPSFFDPVASYSVGAASDRYILIEETCKPLGCKITSTLARICEKLIDQPIKCELDWDDHSTMQQVRRERIDAAIKLWNTGMPMDYVSDYLNLDLPEYAGSDVGFMPFSVSPFDPLADASKDPALGETPPPVAVPPATPAEMVEEAFARRQLGRKVVAACTCSVDWNDLEVKAGDSKDTRLWKNMMAPRRATVRQYESKFNRVLMDARRQVLGKLIAAAAKGITTKALADHFMFDLNQFTSSFNSAIRAVAADALQSGGDQVMAALGIKDPWTMPNPEAISFFADRENKMRNIPTDIFAQISGAIQEGITEGDPMSDIAKRVRAEFNDISKGRARVIAQTETSAAYGTANHAAMDQVGVTGKRWLTSRNANVRPAHRAMEGETIPFQDKFVVENPETGEVDYIDHPSDVNGQPWNVINCFCLCVATKVTDNP
jgi:SPP1 gp7 family putative phage head morphogenesis protein